MYIVFAMGAAVGLYLIFSDGIHHLIKSLPTGERAARSRYVRHVVRIIDILASEGKEKTSRYLYVAVTAAAFLAGCGIVVAAGDAADKRTALLTLALLTALPYVYIRLRLAMLQRAGSSFGEFMIAELKHNYQTQHKNIILAVDTTIIAMRAEQQFAKKALCRLSMRAKRYTDENELADITETFAYTLGTKWGQILADNIYNAVREGTDISAGLEDLLSICKTININISNTRIRNTQSRIMSRYLFPIFCIGLFFMTVKMIGLEKTLLYQFTMARGLMMFVLIVTFGILNYAISIYFEKPKFDI